MRFHSWSVPDAIRTVYRFRVTSVSGYTAAPGRWGNRTGAEASSRLLGGEGLRGESDVRNTPADAAGTPLHRTFTASSSPTRVLVILLWGPPPPAGFVRDGLLTCASQFRGYLRRMLVTRHRRLAKPVLLLMIVCVG